MPKKIGIIGLGSIGNRHFQNFEKLGCEVRAYDTQITAYATRDGPAIDTTNRQEVIDWADALVIATHTAHHYEDILSTGKPLFVEKPIVASTLEWAKVPTKHVVMVGYNLRFHSCVKKVRGWLGEGLIGKPLWARFTCAQFSDKADYIRDGLCLNWSHEIDLALHLLGHAVVMAAVGDDQTVLDIILNHDVHHCQTVVHLDYLLKFERRGFLIAGTNGSIEVDLLRRKAICLDNRGLITNNYQGRDTFDSNYVAEAQAFLDRLDGKTTEGCTADEAMNVANICLLAKEKL
jgi:predicted dehydrogenase